MQKEKEEFKPGDMVMLEELASAARPMWSSPFVGATRDCHITGKLLIGETAMFIAYSSTKIDALVLAPGPKLGWVWAAKLERAQHAFVTREEPPALVKGQ